MAEVFPKASNDTPTKVGRIKIELEDIPAGESMNPIARKDFTYSLQLKNAAGNIVKTIDGDLTPKLTPAQSSALISFMDSMRIKADEALP